MEEQELIPAGAGVHRGTPMEYSTFKAEKWEFRGDVGNKKPFPGKVGRLWKRIPREFVAASFLKVSRDCWSNLGWTWMSFNISFIPNHSGIP